MKVFFFLGGVFLFFYFVEMMMGQWMFSGVLDGVELQSEGFCRS